MIRELRNEDQNEVNLLLVHSGQDPIYDFDKVGGYGLVAEEHGEIVGFLWALVGDGYVAMIEWFVVKESHRGDLKVAIGLMTKMMMDLEYLGVSRVVGVIPESIQKSDALARIYKGRNMTVNKGYIVTGVPAFIRTAMKERAA